jgi:predicted nuclease of predicted toxin-antitoxin system
LSIVQLKTWINDKLLLISTGNISNDALSRLFEANLPALVSALSTHSFVELSATAMIIHV